MDDSVTWVNPHEPRDAGRADGATDRLPPLAPQLPFIAAAIMTVLAVTAALLDIYPLLPFLVLVAIVLVVHRGGTTLIARGGPPAAINMVMRLTNLAAYTIAASLSNGIYSPLIPLYAEDVLSASLRDGRRGAWKGWALVTLALGVVTWGAWPLEAAETIRFLIYVGVMAIIAMIAGELGQERIEVQSALIQQTVENARLYAQLDERAQHLSEAYQELQDLDRRKTEFVQSVSHDLRTPLFFIRGYVELLREGDLGVLNAVQREKLDVVAGKTQLLTDLVRDVVALQRGRPRPEELKELALDEVARQAVIGAEAMAAGLDMTLALQMPDVPLLVRGDAQRLEEVFDNLLSNAIKFSPDGGTITVSAHQGDGRVVVAVADEGIGVPPREHERIFERFYQVDSTTTRRFEGTGLGLAIVKEIVEGHNGQVWIDSPTLPGEPPHGSTFYFSLPVET